MSAAERLWGDPAAKTLFVQLTDEHDLSLMDCEAEALRHLSGTEDWCLLAVPVADWNSDLTPWTAPPAFGRQPFGDGAQRTLDRLEKELLPGLQTVEGRQLCLCGYSLAGLFALWAVYQTKLFSAAVAASPSVWYPGWIDYARQRQPLAGRIYLSLGDREEKTRNPVMAAVGEAIREQHRLLQEARIPCALEWNPGNHFVQSDLRVARGMAWVLAQQVQSHTDLP